MVDQHHFPLPLTSSPQFYPHFNATNPYSLPASSSSPPVLMPTDDVEASGLLSQVDVADPIFPPPLHDAAAVARHHAQLEEMLAPHPASLVAVLPPPPPPPPQTTMPNTPSFPLNPFVPQVAHGATESFVQPPFPLMPFVSPAVPSEGIAHSTLPPTLNTLNSVQSERTQGVSPPPPPPPIGRRSASPATGGSASGSACGSGSASGSGSDGAARTQGVASDAWGVALAKLNASRIATAKWEEEVAVRRPHFGTTEDKEMKRKETNQKSAKISRLRIRAYVAELESVLEAGEQSTRKLKDEVREVEKESQQLESQLVFLRAQVSNVRNLA